MKLVRSLSAGLVDSGLASLATFAVGVYAARTLDAAGLGVFALHFAAFTLVATLSHQGVFIPMEAVAARSDAGLRLLRRSLSTVWLPVLASPAVVLLPVLAAPASRAPLMGLTAAAVAVFSPVQDHVRRMLHLDQRSSVAASVSTVQLLVVVGSLWSLHGTAPAEAVPFLALAVANLVSLTVGMSLTWGILRGEGRRSFDNPIPRLGDLLSSGRWLLGAQLASAAGTFIAASLVGRLGSLEALGFADAARIVARPVLVLTTGMTAVLGPRLMRAAGRRADQDGRAIGRTYRFAVAVTVAGYVAVFGWAHPFNPLSTLVPLAYGLPLLVAATVVANGLMGWVLPPRFEAIGSGRATGLLPVDLLAGVAQVTVGALSGWLHAFALPLSHAAFALVRQSGLGRLRKEIYSRRPAVTAASPATGEGSMARVH